MDHAIDVHNQLNLNFKIKRKFPTGPYLSRKSWKKTGKLASPLFQLVACFVIQVKHSYNIAVSTCTLGHCF